MKHILIFFSLFSIHFISAQVQDDFSDGDFTNNPTWLGDDTVFTVFDVSGNLKLRSNKVIPSTTFYLSTTNSLVQNTQWEFGLKLALSTSSTNFADVYLTADQSDLLAANLNGYFVRMGGTADEICLYKNVNGTISKIIDGTDGIVSSSSNNNYKIKVVCSATGDWTLQHDNTGTGSSYTMEGVATNDVSFTTSAFFGIKITQSTASNFQKHFLDDVYVGPIILDLTPPSIVSASVIDALNFDVLFSENVDQTTAENSSNYSLIPFNSIASATRDAVNLSLVHFVPTFPLGNGATATLTVSGVNDLNGNTLVSENVNLTLLIAQIPQKGDVIITEFLADESPKLGLAEVEFVEIYNKSNKVFNVKDWKLADNSGAFGKLTDAWILPGEYKVLTKTTALDSFPNTIGVTSFQSLNNSGDNVVLRDTGSVILDSLTFTDLWYRDDLKKEGGYSLELINPNDPCSAQDNWIASNSFTGGTPGVQNSVFDITPDTQAPSISAINVFPPNFISVHFSEGMDSLSLVNSLITTNPSLGTTSISVSGQFSDSMFVQFSSNFVGSQEYQVQIQNVGDCWNNTANLSSIFVLPEIAQAGDLVVNEILFDAYTGASDFVEIRNNSDKYIDLKGYQLANFSDSIANIKTITEHFILKKNDFAVITSDSMSVKTNYLSTVPGKFIQMSIPSYNNDSSTVYLLNSATIVDKVSYESDWQFALLNNTDGKSLERISPFASSNDKSNWHTASENCGFATPGKENSQMLYGENEGVISLTKGIFSPDNDGNEDVLQINYDMINAGMLANLSIFDDRGRAVKTLVKSEIIGSRGTFTWDGVLDNNQKASVGTYVLLFDAFDLSGKKLTKKVAFVLAGKI